MKRKMNGFTLLELLIAAALVGVLAMFATQSFRRTASDVRIENAKRGADTIAAASYRFNVAYPNQLPTGVTLSATTDPGDCNPGSNTAPLQQLIDCGFLENRHYWDEGDFTLFLGDIGSVTIYSASSRIKGHSVGDAVYTTGSQGFVQTGYCSSGSGPC